MELAATAPCRTSTDRLQQLLRPRSIALIGGAACAEVALQCRRMGFTGALWPVHPDRTRLRELERVYRCVEDLPDAPDVAFVAVNRHATIDIVAALAAQGAGGAVCYASGFAEAGPPGAELQTRLVAAAGDMPFIGPNCHGLLNYFDGVALWPEQQGGLRQNRGIALITQSGNIALNLTMQARGLPIGYVVTLGNQASVNLADVMEAIAQDERTTAIGLHIEGIRHPSAFVRAAQLARERGIPIVAVKSGRSELGAKLALSHTASIGGLDSVADAFLERAGVVRVRSLAVLLETLKLLHVHGPLGGADIASMSCSGGEASLIADTAASHGLRLRPLTDAQAARVAASLPALATATNPLDYHNFSWNDSASLEAIYTSMLAACYDLAVLVLDFPRRDRCGEGGFGRATDAYLAAARKTRARAAIIATLQENLPESEAQRLIAAGIAPLCGLDDGLAAAGAAARLGRLWLASPASVVEASALGSKPTRTLSEWESKQRLRRYGLVTPDGAKVDTTTAAVTAANTIGYPVVLKSIGSDIVHKTERNAVSLGLGNEGAVRDAAEEQLALHGTELLVERMITDTVAELIVGVGRDPVLGLYLVLGSGGIFVDLLDDHRILMLPATAAEICASLASLRVIKLVHGFRGKPAGDAAAIVAAIMAIQSFALEHRDVLVELDVNPLIVRPLGAGAVAVDALIRTAGDIP
ncbi:MAG TPA: acetate--CoA ligase family protein [Steroidobacteraceae bacterium]|nr:acetate--CoA ligase family protein [Steroidobacteraceae bacterium]